MEVFKIKADKAPIATRHNTVNDEFDKIEETGWHTYIAGVASLATSDGYVCPIGIILMRFNLTDNHVVTNFFSSVFGLGIVIWLLGLEGLHWLWQRFVIACVWQ